MQVAVCDDNSGFLAEFDRLLRTFPQIEAVSCFSSLTAFLSAIEDGRQYDGVFMDIDWDGSDEGMDAAEHLADLSPGTKIIYITGYNDLFSQRVFLRRANLSGYLVKPVDRRLLEANLEKLSNSLPSFEPLLTVRIRGDVLSIPHREILYLEGRGHSVIIHTLQKEITVYQKLEDLCAALPREFCRCHKSFAVNMRHIRRFQQPDILLKNGGTVPVSRARYARTKEEYFKFMGQFLFQGG